MGFNRPRLALDNNSAFTQPVLVTLDESHCFIVDPNANPRSANGTVLPPGNPFSIVSACRGKLLTRNADLGIDLNAVATWHQYFDNKCTIILQMQLSNDTVKDLTVDLFCAQHSTAAANVAALVLGVVHAALQFLIAVFTLRIFRHSKEEEELPEPAHTKGH